MLEHTQRQAFEEGVNTERENDNGVSKTRWILRIELFFLLLPPFTLLEIFSFFLHFIQSQLKFSLESYWVQFKKLLRTNSLLFPFHLTLLLYRLLFILWNSGFTIISERGVIFNLKRRLLTLRTSLPTARALFLYLSILLIFLATCFTRRVLTLVLLLIWVWVMLMASCTDYPITN